MSRRYWVLDIFIIEIHISQIHKVIIIKTDILLLEA